MVDAKRQINVRISEELCTKIESSNRSKQDVISEALLLYFSPNSKQDVAKDLEHEKEKNQLLQDSINRLESNLKDLQQQLGFLQLEYQKISNRLLLEEPKKPWYKFWKK